MGLLKHYFPDLQEEKHVEMANRLLRNSGRKPILDSELKSLLPCLRSLAEEPDGKAFADLELEVQDEQRQKLIIQRFGLSRAAAENMTPASIKQLKPNVKGCSIVWQATEFTFYGAYPKPQKQEQETAKSKKKNTQKVAKVKEHGTRRSYAGGKWTQAQALLKVVSRLWAIHKMYGGESWAANHSLSDPSALSSDLL